VRILMLLCALAASATAAAGEPAHGQPYVWRSWTRLDGLPGSQVWVITQDHAGYIWLGTNQGLVRFDGVRFVSGPQLGFKGLPDRSVRGLFVARDGALWVSYNSGTSRIRGEAIQHYTMRDGLPPGAFFGLAEDVRGTIWGGSSTGLYRLVHGRWERVNLAVGLTTQAVDGIHVDRQGHVWVGTRAGVYRLANEEGAVFERLDAPIVESFAEDAAGNVWGAGDAGLTLLSSTPVRTIAEATSFEPGRKLVADRDGRLWMGTRGDGVLRVGVGRHVAVERFRGPGVLTDDVVRALFEDREGNIWVGSTHGLDRGSKGLIRSLPQPGDGMPTSVQAIGATTDGAVWVGTNTGLFRFAGGVRQDVGPDDAGSRGIVALHGDAEGRMWVATGRGIGRFEHGRFAMLIPHTGPLNRWVGMATDRGGLLWLCDIERGLFTWDGRTLAPVPAAQYGDRAAFSIAVDRRGRIWTGHVDGSIVLRDGGQSRLFTEADGLAGGNVTGFYEDDDGTMWAGAVGGLMRIRDGRVDTVTRAQGLPGNTVTAISSDRDGYLWIGVSAGIVRLHPRTFDDVVAGRATRLALEIFDDSDGLRLDPLAPKAPAVARGGDGRLWFLTSGGVAVVSPDQHTKNRVAPPVVIEGIAADQRSLAPEDDGYLPPRTANVRIDYAALSFVAPEKVQFRYRMEGFDTDWVDAGTRRQAFYTNLPPGQYRFRVSASNDGVPSEREAVWAFTMAPAFYQTRWFAGAMAVLALSVAALAWRVRVRQVRGRFSAILLERTRVAREVHDTLLQSLLGVLFRLDEVANVIDVSSESAKAQLVRLRHQVEFYVREARYSIRDLRSPILQSRGLATAMRAIGDSLTDESPAAFRLYVEGTPRADLQRIDEHLLRIGQEAMTNAVRHGEASSLDVELAYRTESVALRVRDNGKGFDTGRISVGDGVHWGLRTMRERAEQIGGTLRIESAPGEGTLIDVTVPLSPTGQSS
jgi:signal transduction histidine kinase/ligand-binding sensor domain-containing protein